MAPAFGFVVFEGVIGITIKLALRDVGWQQLLLWAAAAYAVLATVLVVAFDGAISVGAGLGWAVVSGAFAALALLVFFIALERGEASRVVPVSAGYPLVTAIVAVVVLSEALTVSRAIGTVLVVGGVVILSGE